MRISAHRRSLTAEHFIEFNTDKKTAATAILKHCRRKILLHKNFLSEDDVLSNLQKVYLPFYFADCRAAVTACYEAVHNKKQISASRSADIEFCGIPCGYPAGLDGNLIRSICNFNLSEGISFSDMPSAEQSYISAATSHLMCDAEIEKHVKKHAAQRLCKTISSYKTAKLTDIDVNISDKKVSCILLPFWILNARTADDRPYVFAVNGQNGACDGNLPLFPKRFWGAFASCLGAFAVIGYLLWVAAAVILF